MKKSSIILILCVLLAVENVFAQKIKPQNLLATGNLSAWRGYHSDTVPSGWVMEDGAITLAKPGAADLITREEYIDFDFSFEWKIQNAGNSGVFYLVKDSSIYRHTFDTGLEYQVLDNKRHRDNKKANHLAGSLYDLVAADSNACHPAETWNKARIVLKKGHLQHYLNGKLVVDTYLWDSVWDAAKAASKFKDFAGFAHYHKGHIGLQDHGDKVWFRNLTITRL